MSDDILCETCADRYSKLLHVQLEKTGEFNARISRVTQFTPDMTTRVEENPGAGREVAQALLEPIQKLKESEAETEGILSESQLLRKQRHTTTLVGYFLLGVGLVSLVASIVLSSSVAAFIGLGLTFWGLLAFFIQPNKYVKSDLMNATAISSLRTIDKMMLGMGYREKGVYIRAEDSDKAVVFVPSEPFSLIPEVSDVEDRIFLSKPEGLLVPPPGLALAALIEKKLGFKLKNCGVQTLVEALPKVLVEDLEIVKDVEIEVKGDAVRFKLYDSIYADFCVEVRETSRRCGLGCPMCSALASILAVATGKPVLYEEDKMSEDNKITESIYQLLSGPRL
jgi:hypothetical protein